jgi:hypothetical protein
MREARPVLRDNHRLKKRVAVLEGVIQEFRDRQRRLVKDLEYNLGNYRAPNQFHPVERLVQEAVERDEAWFKSMEHTR